MHDAARTRLATIADRRRRALERLSADRPARRTRETRLGEIARLQARLADAAAEVNDALDATDVSLLSAVDPEMLGDGVAFRILARDGEGEIGRLDVGVDGHGTVHPVVEIRGRRVRLAEVAVSAASREPVLEWLLDLLDRALPEGSPGG